jgi:DNA-binding helix-hairpin-helix protein with protein kinase domain
MIVCSAKLGTLELETKPFASGGAGQVYHAETSSGIVYCVKLLTKHKPEDLAKLAHMVGNPPIKLSHGWGQVCWPLDLITKTKGSMPVGYVMPMAFKDSCQVTNLTYPRWPGKDRPRLAEKVDRNSSEGLNNRIKIAYNISAAVKEIHAMGHVFVDLKPQNIMISPEGMVSVVDLDSLQIEAGGRLYRGPLGSPDYMPSESYQMQYGVGPAIEPSWDNFSLAVIIYEILLGIHPYTGSLHASAPACATIADSIRLRMYVHGVNRHSYEVIPLPHQAMYNLPSQIAALFLRAFDSLEHRARPTSSDWASTLLAAAKQAGAVLPQTPRVFSAPIVPTSKVENCHGPRGDMCPGYRLGRLRSGAPNFRHPTGSMIYLCPECLPSHQGAGERQNCWGPWGKTCPHELTGRFKAGLPNADARGGLRVYFCPDCIVGR